MRSTSSRHHHRMPKSKRGYEVAVDAGNPNVVRGMRTYEYDIVTDSNANARLLAVSVHASSHPRQEIVKVKAREVCRKVYVL